MKFQLLAVIIFFAFSSYNVYAGRLDYILGLSAAYHTNINLENDPQSDEGVIAATGEIAYTESTANLIANVNAYATYSEYVNDLADDELTGELTGEATWIIKPRSFEWYAADTFTQTVVDPLESFSQENMANANLFTTGPNYFVRIDDTNNFEFELRYTDFRIEDSDADSVTTSGAARWLYRLNSTTLAGISYEERHLDYKSTAFNNYTRSDLIGSIAYRKGLNAFDAKLGQTESVDGFGNVRTPVYASFALTNQRTRKLVIRLGGEHRLSDATTILLDLLEDPLDTDEVIVTGADQFILDRIYAAYIYTSSHFTTGLTVYGEESDYYVDSSLNESVRGINFTSALTLNDGQIIGFDARLAKRDYENLVPSRTDDDSLYSLRYTRNARRNLDFIILLETERRQSTNALDEYVDNRVIASIEYRSR